MAAPPSYAAADLEQHFANTVFPANFSHDLQLRVTGTSLLVLQDLVGSRHIEVAKSLVYRIYAFLDGARSSGILDPYKSWLIDVIQTSTEGHWTQRCAVWIRYTTTEQIPHYPSPNSLLGTSRVGVPRPRGILRVPSSFYVAAWPGAGRVAHVAFLNGQSHTMADPRHWGDIAYQGLFKHLSEGPNGSQRWALYGQKGTAFEAKTDPTRLFEEGTESLSCFFEEHPFFVQGRR